MNESDWPNDEEMSERCCCGHTLGQHEYGDERAPCDHCTCNGIHIVPGHFTSYHCPGPVSA